MPPRKKKVAKKEEKKAKEEEDKEEFLSKYAEILEKRVNGNSPYRTNINHYSYVEIDGVSVDFWVEKETDNTYSFFITVVDDIIKKNDFNSIILLQIKDFKDIRSLLQQIEIVKRDYKLIEHNILSPEDIEYVRMQRTFFQIPTDKNCSVCFESTNEYTICRHPICFHCRYKCVSSNINACPICRENNLKRFPNELTNLD